MADMAVACVGWNVKAKWRFDGNFPILPEEYAALTSSKDLSREIPVIQFSSLQI